MTTDSELPQRITDAEVGRLALHSARADLLEEIMRTPVLDRTRPTSRRTRRRPRQRWLVAATAAAAAVAVILAVPVLVDKDEPQPGAPAPAPPASGERLVLSAPGWRVDHLDDGDAEGEIRYRAGRRALIIDWMPAAGYRAELAERRDDVDPAGRIGVLGVSSPLLTYNAHDLLALRPPDSGSEVFFAVRGGGMGRAAFAKLLGELRKVNRAEFEAALPEEFVSPDEGDAVVQEILADIETPPGFDASTIDVTDDEDRYDLVAEVTGLVACGWITEYDAAQAAGDRAAERRAVEAMEGSRQWDALREIKPEGDWPIFLWEIADAMSAGRPAATLTEPGSGSCEDGNGFM